MNRTKTTTIVLHHSVTDQSFDQAKTMGIIKGSHSGISPYHVVIGKDWVYTDPNQLEVKYHAGNYPVNLESIAVCMVGNFLNDTPMVYQRVQLKKTLEDWMKKYGILRTGIKLHREVRLSPTACPGKLDQNYISLLLKPTMTCEEELPIAKEQIRMLNTELGVVTPQRDKALADLANEREGHRQTLEQLKTSQAEVSSLEVRMKENQTKIDQIKGIIL